MDEKLVDRIYEAAVVGDAWPGLLRGIADMAGAAEAVLIAARGSAWRWVSTSPAFDEVVQYHADTLETHNERTRRFLTLDRAGFTTDLEFFTPEARLEEPIYRDFLIPRGFGWGASTLIRSPCGDAFIFHAERSATAGPADSDTVARLDRLHPHLARAALLSARLELQRIEAAARVLEMVGLPAAVLGRNGRAMAGNRLFDGLVPVLFQDRQARLTLVDAGADLLLGQAIAGLATAGNRTVRSIPVAAKHEQPPTIVHVLPIRGAANDIFASASAVVVVTPVVPRAVPTAEVIQGLFDLTPAEARIARAVGNGDSAAEIAAATGRAEATVRGQLKSILAKTGLHRQSELVGLLRGIPTPDGRGSG